MTVTVRQKYSYTADLLAAGVIAKAANKTAMIAAKAMESAFVFDDKHKLRLTINGFPIDEVKSACLTVSIDSAARGWTAVVPHPDVTGIPGRSELFKPYQYQYAAVYLGGKLQCFSKLYLVNPSINETGKHIVLGGWSPVVDALDSTAGPPYEQNLATLKKRTETLFKPFGISVGWAGIPETTPFKRCTIGKTQKIGDHVLDLARQRNKYLISDEYGDVAFWDYGATLAIPTVLIQEGIPPFKELDVKFDGRERYGLYTVLSSSPKRNNHATAIDDEIPITRHTTVNANDGEDAEMKTSAQREAAKAMVDAMTIPLPMSSWYSDPLNLQLWQANSLVMVKSSSLFIPNGFVFLVRSVDYRYDEDGARATLSLVPPQAYTGERLELW